MLGTRDNAKLAEWAKRHPGANVGGFEATAAFGDLVVLAVKGSAAMDVLHAAGSANLAGKTVIDATNPIAAGQRRAQVQHEPRRFADGTTAMRISWRAFRQSVQLGRQRAHGRSEIRGGKPTMFICGNDDAAKKTVGAILDRFGWETADMGAVEAAIEPLCMLWCIPGFRENSWTHAFKLLR